jgi:hypothetical protein
MDNILIGKKRNVQYLDAGNKSDSSSSDSIQEIPEFRASKTFHSELNQSILKDQLSVVSKGRQITKTLSNHESGGDSNMAIMKK